LGDISNFCPRAGKAENEKGTILKVQNYKTYAQLFYQNLNKSIFITYQKRLKKKKRQ
jgi:hypothetical protein